MKTTIYTPLLSATIVKDGDTYVGEIDEHKELVAESFDIEDLKKMLLSLYWIKHCAEHNRKMRNNG